MSTLNVTVEQPNLDITIEQNDLVVTLSGYGPQGIQGPIGPTGPIADGCLLFKWQATDVIEADESTDVFPLASNFHPTEWMLIVEPTGSVSVDLWLSNYEDGIPTVEDSITNGNYLTITDGDIIKGTDFSGWSTTEWEKGQLLKANIVSAENVTKVLLYIIGQRD